MSKREDQSSRWSELRDLFAATREAMIVMAIVLVLVAPSVVRGSLQRAGITSFAGVEFGVQEVVDAGKVVADAESQVASLSNQIASVEARLDSLSSEGRSAQPEEIREIASAMQSLKSQAASVDQSLMKSTRKIDRAIQLMPPEKLRELSERNARQEMIQQSSIHMPPIQSAQLQGLHFEPSDLEQGTIPRQR